MSLAAVSRDTIFAHSSGAPPAGVAVIRISGPTAHAAGAKLAGKLPPPRRAALRTIRASDGELLDRALVLRFDGPASATGDDVVEIHAHGGRAVVRAILSELAAFAGLREALPGEFTRRAFQNGAIDLTEAEGLADLLEAETEAQRRAALAAADGALRAQIETWRRWLVDLSARAEAAIDYVGDEDETQADVGHLAREAESLRIEMRRWLAEPRAERLRDGIRVVLAGPPNAGKSSLLNALAEEQRAIVTPLAGTTRDVIEVPVSLEGLPLVLVDTAGLRESEDAVESIGVVLAERQVEGADILLWLGPDGSAPDHPNLVRIFAQADRRSDSPGRTDMIAVSALTGEGLAQLKTDLVRLARDLLPVEGHAALNARQAAAIAEVAQALDGMDAGDLVVSAEALRQARAELDRVSGRAGVEDVLDALFSRFCLGK